VSCLVSDQIPHPTAKFVGNPLCHDPRRETPRLQDKNPTRDSTAQQHLWDLCGLSRSRRRSQYCRT
jgi:hypothetical protein